MAKPVKKAESKLLEIMRKFKEDKRESDKNQKITNQSATVAIELSEARKKVAKKPKQ
jgi:hypothetical protein